MSNTKTGVLVALTSAATAAALSLATSCQDSYVIEPPAPAADTNVGAEETKADPNAPGADADEPRPPVDPETAPEPSKRVEPPTKVSELEGRIDSYFARSHDRRIYIQTDKPLYRPGESIWLQTLELDTDKLDGASDTGVIVELVNPRGAVATTARLAQKNGRAPGELKVDTNWPGGEYTIRVKSQVTKAVAERPVIVSAYEPPRIKKKLEFLRKAYGPGDKVSATLELKRATGQPLANKIVTAVIDLDGLRLDPVKVATNSAGGGVVNLTLPDSISRGDGLLTVMVEDGGVTESISKRVPIVLDKIRVDVMPEGGDLVVGLESRVYFSAKNPLGKPADIEGRVVDDRGNEITTLTSYHDGLGRFTMTPRAGRGYRIEITKPVGIANTIALPKARSEGCVMRSYDDFDGQADSIRVAVACSEPQVVTTTAVLREQRLDTAAAKASSHKPAVFHLSPDDDLAGAQGVVRLTAWNAEGLPVAERLYYRGRRAQLDIDIKPDADGYGPRDVVSLDVSVKDSRGKPVATTIGLSVVDDTVLSFADDHTGHLLSAVFLEPELKGKIEKPNFYFDLTEEKSAKALDLLVGTRGYRTFTWETATKPAPPDKDSDGIADANDRCPDQPETLNGMNDWDGCPDNLPTIATRAPAGAGAERLLRREERVAFGAIEPEAEVAAAAPRAAEGERERDELAKALEVGNELPRPALRKDNKPADVPARADEPAEPLDDILARGGDKNAKLNVAGELKEMKKELAAMDEADEAIDGDRANAGIGMNRGRRGPIAVGGKFDFRAQQQIYLAYTAVREFPVPDYSDADFNGIRSDFRDTVYWNPAVETNEEGQARVSFPLSDAVTTFRVTAEAVGDGQPGHAEEVIRSSLPFAMSVKLPLEVSAGDRLLLPLTLTNERNEKVAVKLEASVGRLLTLDEDPAGAPFELAPKARRTVFFPASVKDMPGESQVIFRAETRGLRDQFERTVRVVPAGFPQEVSESGDLKGSTEYTIDVGEVVPNSIEASVRFYPSPVATMVSGLEGLIRSPGGCFEQASSTNYPNIMVMQYLQQHNVANPAVAERANKALDRGYTLLTGYETKNRGYEWFGQSPGHEALTAYGLMEFVDMKAVWGDVDNQMIDRTATWLKSRRDGKGGFARNSRALDSFGRANPEVTNAYITWAVSEAGYSEQFAKEMARSQQVAGKSNDAYVLALTANTLLNSEKHRDAGRSAVEKLAKMQDPTGAWTKADHSITRSGGVNLHIETTALATLALIKSDTHRDRVRKAVSWLNDNRGGYGQWGATQATVLALRAMTTYAGANRKTRNAGSIVVLINGKQATSLDYKEGHTDTITLDGLGKYMKPGKNTVRIVHEAPESMPFSLVASYRSRTPATSPDTVVDLRTEIAKTKMKMGDTVRLTAHVTNKTNEGQPMTLARVGLPGGLSFQTWQLKELKEKGEVGFWETGEREVVLYFRDMKPGEKKSIPLDLVANVPGTYEGPASSGYLYYTDEHKTWAAGLEVTVSP